MNVRTYLGLIGHWITNKGIKKCALLGLWKLEGHHTGENQVEVVRKLICIFGLEYKVSTIE
jgi:hypothetical protein